ncbi:hypothetical protein Pcinc_012725 [Petrolisthes cinctipes]|uniref:Uncharacterized protein n=1 Tax=Petrolisthes cinctipes TaxID=88211 RepID=A0AAE1G014_PETCI|nr:hypothetical protein Pcinc_012725 [Petrolisthes cinctipes]
MEPLSAQPNLIKSNLSSIYKISQVENTTPTHPTSHPYPKLHNPPSKPLLHVQNLYRTALHPTQPHPIILPLIHTQNLTTEQHPTQPNPIILPLLHTQNLTTITAPNPNLSSISLGRFPLQPFKLTDVAGASQSHRHLSFFHHSFVILHALTRSAFPFLSSPPSQ